MDRTRRVIVNLTFWVLPGFILNPGIILRDAHAAVTDTFPLSATVKEWCAGNPKFFENIQIRVHPRNPSADTLLTITRDPQNTGALTTLQATLTTGVADIDAITMNGLAFPTNKSGSTAQIVLFGHLNNGPFFSIRGQANFDKVGALKKVTGAFMFEINDTFTIDKFGNESPLVDCFGSGTFETGKKR